MEYTKTAWKDLPDTSTPITASRLNNIEDGVEYLFENGTGGGDNLPVGVEIDFDGASQDIPTGWQETSNTTQVLWTNPSPTSSFAEQTITLSSGNYDFYEIYCTYNGSTASQYANGFKTIKGKGLIISEHGYGTDLSVRRKVDYTDATHLYISGAYAGANTDNGYLVPIYVIGYKTGTFNSVSDPVQRRIKKVS
jgi:hypothetical protein